MYLKRIKEIEELKKKNKYLSGSVNKKYISKNEIKAKINQLNYNDISNFERRCKQEVLEEILEKGVK